MLRGDDRTKNRRRRRESPAAARRLPTGGDGWACRWLEVEQAKTDRRRWARRSRSREPAHAAIVEPAARNTVQVVVGTAGALREHPADNERERRGLSETLGTVCTQG